MNRNMLPLTVAVLALAGVPVLAQGHGKNASASPNKNSPQQLPPVGPAYVIGTKDTLFVSVWKEPELTNTLPVRADGMISMRLLNDVRAAGLTPMQLAASITEKLKKYVEDPHVTVVVTQMNSQKVYVTGAFSHGGVMVQSPNMPLLETLATGEFTQFAEREKAFWAWLKMVKGAEREYKKKRGRYGDLDTLRKAHLVRTLFASDTTAGATLPAMGMLFQVTASEDGRHFRASIADGCLSANADDMGGEWSVCCCLSPSLHRDFEDSQDGAIISVAR